jgi:hypothetical protein
MSAMDGVVEYNTSKIPNTEARMTDTIEAFWIPSVLTFAGRLLETVAISKARFVGIRLCITLATFKPVLRLNSSSMCDCNDR